MKNIRQKKILELIKVNSFETQDDLLKKLRECGFKATQATVSRDIRELGLVKSEGEDGIYKYRLGKERENWETNGKFESILRHAVFNVARANNLIVVKTYAGMGSAAGAAFDALGIEGVVGTLAGDDTLLIVAADNETAQTVEGKLSEIIG